MELYVVGCHGGETPRHRTSSFVLDGDLAVDAGALTSGLTLKDQAALSAVVVSHAHLDHVRDLATVADNRCQLGAEPLVIAGTKPTLSALKKHFFNNRIWPDFASIPSGEHASTIRYVELSMKEPTMVAGREVRAVPVHHTIESAALFIRSAEGTLAYSGDTGPTDRLWQELGKLDDLRALLMEVSFPNREAALALVSGHHTPKTMAADLAKMSGSEDVPTLLFHIKPVFQREVEKECSRVKGLSLDVMELEDQYVL